jgi:hypothetical protein
MSGRLKKPSTPEPAPEIKESGSPEATMATATTIMMAVIKRSNIIFPLGETPRMVFARLHHRPVAIKPGDA